MRKAAAGSGGELCMLLLLLACGVATWPVSTVAATGNAAAATPEEALEPQQEGGLPWPWNDFLPPVSDGKIFDCWKSLLGTDNCVSDLFRSFFQRNVQLSRGCCEAVDALGDYCFPKIFGSPPFGSWFPPLIKSFCAAPAPAPTTPPPSKVLPASH